MNDWGRAREKNSVAGMFRMAGEASGSNRTDVLLSTG